MEKLGDDDLTDLMMPHPLGVERGRRVQAFNRVVEER